MDKSSQKIAVDYILQNTSKAELDKAIKNYNFLGIIQPHQEWLMNNIFFRDGVQYSRGIVHLFDDYLTAGQASNAEYHQLETKALERELKTNTDKKFVSDTKKEIKELQGHIEKQTAGLKKLTEYHTKINAK